MKIFYVLILCSFISLSSYAQDAGKFYFETDFVSKFSIGETTRQTIDYKPGVSADVPKVSKFNNPVYGLNINFNYNITNHFSIGIGSGLNIVKFDNHPVIGYEYHDKIFVPGYLRLRFQQNIKDNWIFLTDLNSGYQYYDFRYGNSTKGFYFKEKGGLLFNLNIGLGKTFNKYTPIIKVGYELNQLLHDESLGWIEHSDLNYDDKIDYKTYYHLIKISLSLKI